MLKHMLINSRTNGKFEKRVLNGREHIVTKMVPIVANTVMNSILYPEASIASSYMQLDNLPAPNGHPVVNGRATTAFHPAAINAHNIGGFIKNPRRDASNVVCEFWLDIETANQSDDGKELISRIENSESVGVSTGLTLDGTPKKGLGADNVPYQMVAQNLQFDHVAILLNEDAAGKHVGTELVLNNQAVEVASLQSNATTATDIREKLKELISDLDGYVYVIDFYVDEPYFVYEVMPEDGPCMYFKQGYAMVEGNLELAGEPVEVERKVEYVAKEETALMPVTNEEATAHLEGQGMAVLNSEQKAEFEAFKQNAEKEKADLITKIMSNSKMTESDLQGMATDGLRALAEMVSRNVPTGNTAREPEAAPEAQDAPKVHVNSASPEAIVAALKEDK